MWQSWSGRQLYLRAAHRDGGVERVHGGGRSGTEPARAQGTGAEGALDGVHEDEAHVRGEGEDVVAVRAVFEPLAHSRVVAWIVNHLPVVGNGLGHGLGKPGGFDAHLEEVEHSTAALHRLAFHQPPLRIRALFFLGRRRPLPRLHVLRLLISKAAHLLALTPWRVAHELGRYLAIFLRHQLFVDEYPDGALRRLRSSAPV